jgi:molybdopterin/thiamine biosynthesis adenylyltransferase
MVMILAMMAALWGIGHLMRVPRRLRWGMIAALWAGVVVAHLLLPAAHPLRLATGGRAEVWLVLGGLAGLGLLYRALLARLRGRAVSAAVSGSVPGAAGATGATTTGPEPFRAAELDRYARHIMLREIGGPGQRRLKDARVLVVGAGGLGSPALLYLAAAGVGTLGVIDDDVVDASNLQRQIIHADERIGQPKVHSAATAIAALNPFVTVRPYARRLTEDIAADLLADYDLVLDGSDNFDTRYLVNRAAVAAGKPLVSAAITQWEGQLSLFHPAAGTPCYACVFPTRPAPGLVPSCAEAGVAAPLPGVIGAMMAMEAVKQLTGAGTTLAGRLLIHDALHAETRVIALSRAADCPVCGAKAGA